MKHPEKYFCSNHRSITITKTKSHVTNVSNFCRMIPKLYWWSVLYIFLFRRVSRRPKRNKPNCFFFFFSFFLFLRVKFFRYNETNLIQAFPLLFTYLIFNELNISEGIFQLYMSAVNRLIYGQSRTKACNWTAVWGKINLYRRREGLRPRDLPLVNYLESGQLQYSDSFIQLE